MSFNIGIPNTEAVEAIDKISYLSPKTITKLGFILSKIFENFSDVL